MSTRSNVGRVKEEFPRVYMKYDEEKDVFDEGVFVSEFVNDDDDQDDDEYDYIQERRTPFEKCLSKIDDDLRQSEQDAQFLSHDLKVIESKNESTERRILKLSRAAAELRSRLNAFLQSFDRHTAWRDPVALTSSSNHVSMASPRDPIMSMMSSPRNHKTTYAIYLKQNSIEQPVHVNIALRENDSFLTY